MEQQGTGRFPYRSDRFTPFKGRHAFTGAMVEVYFNLHLKKWTIRDRWTKLVLGHAEDAVWLKDAEFIVSEAGRQRVIKEQKKNVHAVVRGIFLGTSHKNDTPEYNYSKVIFNPYKYQTFVFWARNYPASYRTYQRCYLKDKSAFVLGG